MRKSVTIKDLEKNPFFKCFQTRELLVRQFAWAIPNAKAIREIAKLGPFIEIGAGNGYWAYLLQQAGVQVKPYDIFHSKKTWTKVTKGGPDKLLKALDKYNLILCWPPYNSPMALKSLKNFKGKYVVYVGEGHGGCTADAGFHKKINSEYKLVKKIKIPQYPNIHDRVFIYERC